MSLLDAINPFNKTVDSISDAVDEFILDKDKALQLKTQIELSKQDMLKEVERSYQIALQTKTNPYLDGIHKLGRQGMSMLVLLASYSIIGDWTEKGIPLSMEHVLLVASLSGPTGIYMYLKGRGKP